MKFPRNSKILRSQFDVAPFAAVFFLVMIFLLLGTLMPVPGLRMQLNPPAADDLPGVAARTIPMAVDATGRYYLGNENVTEKQLKTSLRAAREGSSEPLTLVIHADRAVTYDQLTHLALLARETSVGITNILLATLPRVTDKPTAK
jgi:biopolymer transport protein ExbD